MLSTYPSVELRLLQKPALIYPMTQIRDTNHYISVNGPGKDQTNRPMQIKGKKNGSWSVCKIDMVYISAGLIYATRSI